MQDVFGQLEVAFASAFGSSFALFGFGCRRCAYRLMGNSFVESPI